MKRAVPGRWYLTSCGSLIFDTASIKVFSQGLEKALSFTVLLTIVMFLDFQLRVFWTRLVTVRALCQRTPRALHLVPDPARSSGGKEDA